MWLRSIAYRLGQVRQQLGFVAPLTGEDYEEAARVNRGYAIGTEHLLLGLLREEEGLAPRVLAQLGADIERVHAPGT